MKNDQAKSSNSAIDQAKHPSSKDVKAGSMSFSCSLMPEFEWLQLHSKLRNDILSSHEGQADRLQAQLKDAMAMVELHVFQRMNYRGHGHAVLNRLLNKGYAREQITQALSLAWLNEQDHFELPKRSPWLWVHSLWSQLLFSLTVSISMLGMGLKLLRHSHPAVAVYVLSLPPLLGIAGFALLFPVLWLLKKLLRLKPTPDLRGSA